MEPQPEARTVLFDHRKTWEFTLKASPSDCHAAFAQTFSSYKPLAHAKWDVKRSGSTATATYLGRGGIHGIAAGSSRTAGSEQSAAAGSQVSFVTETNGDGHVTCRMWLSKHTPMYLVAIADAKFLRAYMRAVPAGLRKLDPAIAIAKG